MNKSTKASIEKDNIKNILDLEGKIELRYTLEEFLECRRKDVPADSSLPIHTIKKLLSPQKLQRIHHI